MSVVRFFVKYVQNEIFAANHLYPSLLGKGSVVLLGICLSTLPATFSASAQKLSMQLVNLVFEGVCPGGSHFGMTS